MRSPAGVAWVERLSREARKKVYCAADFMGRPRRLLEAQRRELYAAVPVCAGWHEDYACGRARVDDLAPSALPM